MKLPSKGLIGLAVSFAHPERSFLPETTHAVAKRLNLRYVSVILREAGDSITARVTVVSQAYGRFMYTYQVGEGFVADAMDDKRCAYLPVLLIRGVDDTHAAVLRQYTPKNAAEALSGDFLPHLKSV